MQAFEVVNWRLPRPSIRGLGNGKNLNKDLGASLQNVLPLQTKAGPFDLNHKRIFSSMASIRVLCAVWPDLAIWWNLGNFSKPLATLCPNLPHSKAIFVKVSISMIFLVKSFFGNFYGNLATFTGHTDCAPLNLFLPSSRSRSVYQKKLAVFSSCVFQVIFHHNFLWNKYLLYLVK